jgi:hypothetical protein
MDQEVLVKAGHLIIKTLGDEGALPRAALWVHATDTDTWKLWILPHSSLTDKREFYRRIASIVSKHRPELDGVDAADVEMVTDKHPAIEGMRRARAFKATGQSVINVKNSLVNGYYLAEAIILQMDL